MAMRQVVSEKKMYRLVDFQIVLSVALLVGCQTPPKQQDQNASESPQLVVSSPNDAGGDTTKEILIDALRGYWMSDQYAQILKSTRSPRAAYYPPGMVVPFCRIHELGISWGIHDGSGIGISFLAPLHKDDIFVLHDQEGKALPDRFTMNPSDSLRRFTWNHPANESIPAFGESFFLLSDSVEHFINQYTIAGTYVDSNGVEYSFTINGIAKWPGKTFRYIVNDDFAFNQANDFLINFNEYDSTGSDHVVYGYRWNGNRLALCCEKPYTEDTGEQILLEDHPFVVLIPK